MAFTLLGFDSGARMQHGLKRAFCRSWGFKARKFGFSCSSSTRGSFFVPGMWIKP